MKIHHRNLQFLAVEIYKALNKLSSSLVPELFQVKDAKYRPQNGNILVSKKVKTVSYGKESISYLAPLIWNQIPDEIKNSKSFQPNVHVPSVRHTKCGLYLICYVLILFLLYFYCF